MIPRVWAPFARDGVEIEIVGADGTSTREAMRALAGAWYEATRELAAGTRYFFRVDAGPPTPDPRSRFQPDGPHGPSCIDDVTAFAWSDADRAFRAPPLSSAVVYEMHIGCFSKAGTFESAIEHLDHLVELGVTHVELMPVVEAPGDRGWGYDGVDLYAPHHAWGGPRGLRALVDACHRKGLAVVVDVVYNHLGPRGNYLDRFGPYFTDDHKTPWGRAVNLDGRDAFEVRRFFVDNAHMWFTDFHVDGLRLDAIHALYDASATPFLAELACEKAKIEAELRKPLVVIAESDLNDARVIRDVDAHGLAMDGQWSDDFHHALHVAITGETTGYYADFSSTTLDDVARALNRGFVYDGRFSAHRGRVHGAPLDHEAQRGRLVGYVQTHDQVGNRAKGERISQLASTERVMIAAGLVLTSPFVPMLFMGEEWAAATPFQFFCEHEEDLAQSIRDGRRREFASFGWKPDDIPDPQALDTFLRSKLDFSESKRDPHARVLQWYRDLVALRRAHVDLGAGTSCVARIEGNAIVVERGRFAVAANFAAEGVDISLPREAHEVVLSSTPVEFRGNKLGLPHASLAVVKLAD